MKAILFAVCSLFAVGCVIDSSYADPEFSSTPTPRGQLAVLAADSPNYSPGSTFTIVNDSSYDFHDIAIAQVGDPIWSENLLGDDPLLRHEELTVENVECGTYDVLIVDDTDRVCVLDGFPLCNGDQVTTWITDYDLASADCD